jgi:hypothetical protein
MRRSTAILVLSVAVGIAANGVVRADDWHSEFRRTACSGDFDGALSILDQHASEFAAASPEAFDRLWLQQTTGQIASASRAMDANVEGERVVALCTRLPIAPTLSTLWQEAAAGNLSSLLIDRLEPAAAVVSPSLPPPPPARPAPGDAASALGPPDQTSLRARTAGEPAMESGARSHQPTIQLGFFRIRASAEAVQQRVIEAGVGLAASQLMIVEDARGGSYRLVAAVTSGRAFCDRLKRAGIDCLPLHEGQ